MALLLASLSGLGLAACETTQDKAAALAAEGQALVASQEGVVVKEINKEVKVVSTTLLKDEFGEAVVVELENTSNEAQVELPINIDVLNAKGKSVFSNDVAGLDPTLTYVPLLLPGETSYWVNDQILASGTPKSVKVKVGTSEETAPPEIPELAVTEPQINIDPSGIEVEGKVTNKSQVDQEQLILFGVAVRGGEVVAAGRGLFKKLAVGSKPFPYNIFVIGDPRGADVEVLAPPSVLE